MDHPQSSVRHVLWDTWNYMKAPESEGKMLKPRLNQHIVHMEVASISKLSPFSALILSIACVVIFFFRYIFFERFIMPHVYKNTFFRLSDSNKRGFINHHIAGSVKIMLLVVASYPFIDVVFGKSSFRSGYAGSHVVTMGDLLVVCTQIFVGIYIFEIFYRNNISPVSIFHHIGTIIIAETAIAISLNIVAETDATFEFMLCLIWGAFDCLIESVPHVSVILYRIYPDSHHFLRRLFGTATVITFGGTIFETAIVFYVFGNLWQKWTIAFKVVTPILHVAFSMTQLHGSRILLLMTRKEHRIIREQEKAALDAEATAGLEVKSGGSAEVPVIVTSAEALAPTAKSKGVRPSIIAFPSSMASGAIDNAAV